MCLFYTGEHNEYKANFITLVSNTLLHINMILTLPRKFSPRFKIETYEWLDEF